MTDRDAWLAERRGGIGASDAWRLFAEPYGLWAEKSGLADSDDLSDVEYVQWGARLESAVIAELAHRAGVGVVLNRQIMHSTAHPWALCTVDAWTDAGEPVEAKTAGGWLAEAWADGPPPRYIWQVQHQMLVSGASRVLTGCLLGGQRLVWTWVDRDESAIAALIAAGSDMWRRVQTGDAPPVDGSDRCRRSLARQYPSDDGSSVALPVDMTHVADELDELKDEIKAKSVRVSELEARIKSAIGGSASGVLPDGSGWSWKAQTRKAFTVEESQTRVLRRVKGKR